MKAHTHDTVDFHGLSYAEVEEQRRLFGVNKDTRRKNLFLESIASVVFQPMFILLLVACFTYFFVGQTEEALTMLAALIFVAGIDVFQNFRSQRAVKALSRITRTKVKVIREGRVSEIASEGVVKHDIIICEEGTIIPADSEIVTSNDFAINEAILTGESVSVEKTSGDKIMQGTLVVRGYCYARVDAIGDQTELAGIKGLLEGAGKVQTPLQRNVSSFVRVMVIFGTAAFLFVWIYYSLQTGNILTGLLHGLTMAMSVLPEEIPVALSTFMALGAYRLYKSGVIARTPQTVETLGSATVICVDKTGTLTQNLMTVTHIYDDASNKEIDFNAGGRYTEVLEYAMWASEVSPFDNMEKSIHETYQKYVPSDKRKDFHMFKEYPLGGTPPVMTHVFMDSNRNRIIACKGGVESILKMCHLTGDQALLIHQKAGEYAQKGFRVLGVAKGYWEIEKLPESQEELNFTFLGLITFNDPPEKNIPEVIQNFYAAGVSVVMITGDFPETAASIARLTGIKSKGIMEGSEITALEPEQLKSAVSDIKIFARVSPENKLRIIDALKANNEIVAMTGDGVNDAPALKAAHIGIAMGRRGTEVAKGAAGLILANDDLSKMVDAIFLGRRINENLKKAFRYIISIHIPIIALVTSPIFFTWLPAMLFTPVHVIFLELIMGPTCSIIYENEPANKEELKKPANLHTKSLLNRPDITITVIQGLMITLGCIIAGYIAVSYGFEENRIRSYVFGTLIFSNIFLTLINRSFSQTINHTIKIRNRLIPMIICISLVIYLLILYLPEGNRIFRITPLDPGEVVILIGIAFVFTFWMELYKYFRPRFEKNKGNT